MLAVGSLRHIANELATVADADVREVQPGGGRGHPGSGRRRRGIVMLSLLTKLPASRYMVFAVSSWGAPAQWRWAIATKKGVAGGGPRRPKAP